MFQRILIANRGEIAARIARTAHRMGVSTVGVYSEPDRRSLHVDAVDLAVALGGSTPAESYLRADAVIDAALANGVERVHVISWKLPDSLLLEVFTNEGTGTLVVNDTTLLTAAEQAGQT